ncbi:hypothetical protein D3C75_1035130 [compost metagenome]
MHDGRQRHRPAAEPEPLAGAPAGAGGGHQPVPGPGPGLAARGWQRLAHRGGGRQPRLRHVHLRLHRPPQGRRHQPVGADPACLGFRGLLQPRQQRPHAAVRHLQLRRLCRATLCAVDLRCGGGAAWSADLGQRNLLPRADRAADQRGRPDHRLLAHARQGLCGHRPA